MSRNEIADRLNDKVYKALNLGLGRKELTVLMPIEYHRELLLINDTITYNHIIISGETEVCTVVGVTVKPIRDIDDIYVCL